MTGSCQYCDCELGPESETFSSDWAWCFAVWVLRWSAVIGIFGVAVLTACMHGTCCAPAWQNHGVWYGVVWCEGPVNLDLQVDRQRFLRRKRRGGPMWCGALYSDVQTHNISYHIHPSDLLEYTSQQVRSFPHCIVVSHSNPAQLICYLSLNLRQPHHLHSTRCRGRRPKQQEKRP